MWRQSNRIDVAHRTSGGRVRVRLPGLCDQPVLAARVDTFLNPFVRRPFALRPASNSLIFPDAGDPTDIDIVSLCRDALCATLSDRDMPRHASPVAPAHNGYR